MQSFGQSERRFLNGVNKMFQVVIADSKMLKMKDTQKKYRMLVDRYNHFMSQNESFFSVLEKCRVNISPATKCIKSIYQVEKMPAQYDFDTTFFIFNSF